MCDYAYDTHKMSPKWFLYHRFICTLWNQCYYLSNLRLSIDNLSLVTTSSQWVVPTRSSRLLARNKSSTRIETLLYVYSASNRYLLHICYTFNTNNIVENLQFCILQWTILKVTRAVVEVCCKKFHRIDNDLIFTVKFTLYLANGKNVW